MSFNYEDSSRLKGNFNCIILEALDREEDLSEWDVEFIGDMAGREDYEILTPPQVQHLKRIDAKLDD